MKTAPLIPVWATRELFTSERREAFRRLPSFDATNGRNIKEGWYEDNSDRKCWTMSPLFKCWVTEADILRWTWTVGSHEKSRSHEKSKKSQKLVFNSPGLGGQNVLILGHSSLSCSAVTLTAQGTLNHCYTTQLWILFISAVQGRTFDEANMCFFHPLQNWEQFPQSQNYFQYFTRQFS